MEGNDKVIFGLRVFRASDSFWEVAKALDLIGFTITGAYRHYVEAGSLPVDVDDITEAVASSTLILSSIVLNKIVLDLYQQNIEYIYDNIKYFKIYLDELRSEFHINAIKKLSASINEIITELFNNILVETNDNNIIINNYFNIVDKWMSNIIRTNREEQVKYKLSLILNYLREKSLIFRMLYDVDNRIKYLLLSGLPSEEAVRNSGELRALELAVYDIGLLSYRKQLSYKTYILITNILNWKPIDIVKEEERNRVPLFSGATRLLQRYPRLPKIQRNIQEESERTILLRESH